jgi:hypothetical protein
MVFSPIRLRSAIAKWDCVWHLERSGQMYYWLVLRDGLLPVAIGAVAGIAVAFGSARVVSSLRHSNE